MSAVRALDVAIVAAGAAAGGALRYSVGAWVLSRWEHAFPWHTFAINIAGAFAIGLLAAFSVDRQLIHEPWRLLLGTGVLGGFTTFSALSFETLTLLGDGKVVPAAVYSGGSLIAGVLAAAAGVLLGRAI